MSNEKTEINFMRGVPADESLPIEEMKVATLSALDKYGYEMMRYDKGYGFAPLRKWLAAEQNVSFEQVIIVNSSLQIIDFLCHHFIKPGDTVFTEVPTFDRTITLLRRHEANIIGIPLEEDGPNIEALETALVSHKPKFFYLIPDFQNPMGATCSLAKRQKILALAEAHGFWIIEDAPYRPLRYQGEEIPTLFELNPEHVLHIFSFTKLVGPGVRVGVLYGQKEQLAKIAKFAEDTYICPSLFSQGAVYEFCDSGKMGPQIERVKALYAPRLQACRDAVAEQLPDVKTTRPEGGFFLSITLPEGISTEAVREQAKIHRLNLSDGQGFFPNGGGERFLRLPYCGLTPAEINEGISRLATTVRDLQS
jgi:DNA-binding transcriptional MocR family regulator